MCYKTLNIHITISNNMEKAEILEILEEYNFWRRELDTGIRRDSLLTELKRLLRINEIVVVSGVRRSGKSTLCLQLCKSLIENGVRKEDILIVNFEDPRFRNLNLEILNKIYEVYITELNPSKEHYIVFDEVQAIEGWEKFVRYLHENKKTHVLVTGSSSKLLGSEYATVLAGRHVDMEISPLSFSEFLLFRGIHIKNNLDMIANRHKIKRHLSEYMKWGGFPKVILTEREQDKKELLLTYFRDIMIKDVVSRYKIKEINKLEELAKYYLSNVSSLQSFNKIKDILKLSLDTIERFSYYLSNVYLLFLVKKFSYSEKEQILNPKKIYSIDTGIRNSVGFIFSKDLGKVIENMVFNELKRTHKEIYYWKDYQQKEVDFVLKDGLKVKELIQVCWDIGNMETREREIKGLIKAMKEFKLKEGLIITDDYESEETIKGKRIVYKPLWKWLLLG